MAKYDFDIGIIGGGAAGLTVASGTAQLGAKTLLIEKEPLLGGDCLHFGCVPSKTLIKSAHVYHTISQAKKFGLPEATTAPIDFKDIAHRIQNVIATIQVHDSVERFTQLGTHVMFGHPCFTSEHEVIIDGKTFSSRYWVIASGSDPSAPKLKTLENISYLTNKDIFSLEALPKSLIILGGGPIAIEMAQAFNRLGSEVTVIQRSDQILSKEDKDMANTVMEQLKEEGVQFYLNATVTHAEEINSGAHLTINSKDHEQITLSGEQILLAQGRSPNTNDLGLSDIELEYSNRGIIVDNRLRTNHKHIFAAGDVTGKYQFTHAAGYEGGIVISNAIFRLPRKTNYTLIPWCTYTDPELASIGHNEKSAQQNGIDYSVWTEPFHSNDRALAEGSTTGKIKMLLNKKGKPIGVQILGPRAGDLLGEWVAVLGGKIKLSSLAGMVHPYPTLSEINKRIVGSYLSPKIFSNTIRKTLKILYSLQGK